MSVKIRLKRMGAKKRPYYRLVVMDVRAPRDGRALDELGYYRPVEKDGQIFVKEDKWQLWLSRGAQPTLTVKQLVGRYQATKNA